MDTPASKFPKVRVRPARYTDATRIAALCGQLGYPSPPSSVQQRLRDLLASRNHAIWVAEQKNGQIAGWIHIFVKRLLESDREAEIGGLVIDETFRGHGAGRALVERAERWARARHLKSIYLRSNVIRKEARPFYQGLGYKIIKTQFAFRKLV